MPKENAKTENPRIIEKLPDCIWGMLKPEDYDRPISKVKAEVLTRRMQIAGGFLKYEKGKKVRIKPWPNDATRHTFATNHLAAFKDPGLTSMNLGHEGNPTLLYKTYAAVVSQAEGLLYFEGTRLRAIMLQR